MHRLKVLVAHAAAGGARPLERELAAHEDGARLVHERVGRGEDLFACVDRRPFDVVVFGVALGGPADLAVMAKLRDHAPDAAIVVVTSTGSPSFALDAVRHGAQDCLVRGRLAGAPLGRILRFAVERQRRLTEIRAVALVDELTGLYNRRGFLALAQQQLRIADRLGSRLCQIFVDLDGLKRINDGLGHPAGDRALAEAADLLRETFRDCDVIARVGGDEFAVLTLDTTAADADAMLARLAERVAVHNAWLGRDFAISLSTGLAMYDGASPSSVGELLARADAWMYTHKRSKRLGAA